MYSHTLQLLAAPLTLYAYEHIDRSMCAHVSTYVYTYASAIHVCIELSRCVYVSLYIYICTYECLNKVCLYLYMYVYTYKLCVFIYTRMSTQSVCVYTFIYMCAHTLCKHSYVHTYMHHDTSTHLDIWIHT